MVDYVPILRWKAGERDALGHIAGAASPGIIPLIVFGEDLKIKKATKKTPAIQGPDFFCHEILGAWGGRPFYLDASNIAPTSAGNHILVGIANVCGAAGTQLIPATILGAPPPYQAAVQTVAQQNQRGCALRISPQELSNIAQWVGSWFIPLNRTDLIVDFKDSVGLAAGLMASLVSAFQNLHGWQQWRSITFAGTSMPENFTGYNNGLHTVTRHEWQIWGHLAANLPYQINYADYATVPIVPPPEGIRYGFPINVRYTLPTEFLICKGVVTRGPTGVDQSLQLVGHAQSIVAYHNRHPIQCWADRTIDRIAAGTESPGALVKWVTIGVNRHIQLVRTLLP
jgi:hypothetical protein